MAEVWWDDPAGVAATAVGLTESEMAVVLDHAAARDPAVALYTRALSKPELVVYTPHD